MFQFGTVVLVICFDKKKSDMVIIHWRYSQFVDIFQTILDNKNNVK